MMMRGLVIAIVVALVGASGCGRDDGARVRPDDEQSLPDDSAADPNSGRILPSSDHG